MPELLGVHAGNLFSCNVEGSLGLPIMRAETTYKLPNSSLGFQNQALFGLETVLVLTVVG